MRKLIFIGIIGILVNPAFSQEWDVVSTFDNYEEEDWFIFREPRAGTEITQNGDGTVTISRLGADSETVYLTRDVSWNEPPEDELVDYFRTGNGIILDPNEPQGEQSSCVFWDLY